MSVQTTSEHKWLTTSTAFHNPRSRSSTQPQGARTNGRHPRDPGHLLLPGAVSDSLHPDHGCPRHPHRAGRSALRKLLMPMGLVGSGVMFGCMSVLGMAKPNGSAYDAMLGQEVTGLGVSKAPTITPTHRATLGLVQMSAPLCFVVLAGLLYVVMCKSGLTLVLLLILGLELTTLGKS